jgi:hypothetical protein
VVLILYVHDLFLTINNTKKLEILEQNLMKQFEMMKDESTLRWSPFQHMWSPY